MIAHARWGKTTPEIPPVSWKQLAKGIGVKLGAKTLGFPRKQRLGVKINMFHKVCKIYNDTKAPRLQKEEHYDKNALSLQKSADFMLIIKSPKKVSRLQKE